MKYLYIVNHQAKLTSVEVLARQGDTATVKRLGSTWHENLKYGFYKETPEEAWAAAIVAVKRSVKEQKEDLKDAERELKKTLALLAKVEQRSKESLK